MKEYLNLKEEILIFDIVNGSDIKMQEIVAMIISFYITMA